MTVKELFKMNDFTSAQEFRIYSKGPKWNDRLYSLQKVLDIYGDCEVLSWLHDIDDEDGVNDVSLRLDLSCKKRRRRV